jgi:hypothetical protein
MIGNNELRFNYGTMNAIVQHYLESVLFKNMKYIVTEVSEVKSDNNFRVYVEEVKEIEEGGGVDGMAEGDAS